MNDKDIRLGEDSPVDEWGTDGWSKETPNENPMFDKRKAIEETYNNFWNVRDEYKTKSLDDLVAISNSDRLPFAVCVINITGDLNVGMMMRTACLMGAERFIIFGRRKYDKRSTVGAQNYIEVVRIDAMIDDKNIDVSKFHLMMEDYHYVPFMFETNGLPFARWNAKKFLPYNPCLVFGNEGYGLPSELLSTARPKTTISIPQRGVLRSLNVSSAAAIAMYEVAQQLSAS